MALQSFPMSTMHLRSQRRARNTSFDLRRARGWTGQSTHVLREITQRRKARETTLMPGAVALQRGFVSIDDGLCLHVHTGSTVAGAGCSRVKVRVRGARRAMLAAEQFL